MVLTETLVAQGYDDCEGDFLERVRALAGPQCVIGVEIDPHCHLTKKRCGLADVIVSRAFGPLARVAYAAEMALGRHVERDDVIVLCHGGPIATPEDASTILAR